MQQFTQEGRNAVADLATRYRLTPATVEHMLVAVNNGAGAMAQFNCPELGGSGQWMRGGMTMVGDMFNHNLKSTVDNLCNELSQLLASTSVFTASASGGLSGSAQWWPDGLGSPISSGSQNNSRYAVFADRLAVDGDGKVTVYDTSGHQIGGVSQQQGGSNSMTFSSQLGTVSVDSLPVVEVAGESESAESAGQARPVESAEPASTEPEPEANESAPEESSRDQDKPSRPTDALAAESVSEVVSKAALHTAPPQSANTASSTTAGAATSTGTTSGTEALALIEKLAQLHGAGILNDEEFSAKKRELLARI